MITARRLSAPATATFSSKPSVPLTWTIQRTASRELPVYPNFRGDKVFTVVRRYQGNSEDLKQALQAVVGLEVDIQQRVGRIDVHGSHTVAIKKWLEGLGF